MNWQEDGFVEISLKKTVLCCFNVEVKVKNKHDCTLKTTYLFVF